MWISRIFPEHFFCATTSGSSYTSRWKLDQWLLMTHVLQFNNEVEIQYWQKKMRISGLQNTYPLQLLTLDEIYQKMKFYQRHTFSDWTVWKIWFEKSAHEQCRHSRVGESKSTIALFLNSNITCCPTVLYMVYSKFQYNVLPYSSLYAIF